MTHPQQDPYAAPYVPAPYTNQQPPAAMGYSGTVPADPAGSGGQDYLPAYAEPYGQAHPGQAVAVPGQVVAVPESGLRPVTGYPEENPRAFVRVTVLYDTTRTDLLLPGNLAIVDILPPLIRRVTPVNALRATQGFVLRTAAGKALQPGHTLFEEDVEDGNILTLAPRVKEQEKKYDDLVEAIADSVEATNKPWTPEHSAALATAAAIAFTLGGTVLLAAQRATSGMIVPIILGVVTLLLLGVTWALERGKQPMHAVALGLLATTTGAAAGGTITHGIPLFESPLVYGGLAATLVAAAAFPILTTWRELLLAPVVAGVALAIVGGLNIAFNLELNRIALGAIGILGIALLLIPMFAFRSARIEESEALINPDLTEISPKVARRAYLRGRRMMFSGRIGAIFALAVLAPLVVGDVPGSLVLLAAVTIILLLGTRRAYASIDVIAQYLGALLLFTVTFISLMLAFPHMWVVGVMVGFAIVVVLIGFGLFIDTGRAVFRRGADVLEILAVLVIIPATVMAMELW